MFMEISHGCYSVYWEVTIILLLSLLQIARYKVITFCKCRYICNRLKKNVLHVITQDILDCHNMIARRCF